MDKSLLFFYCMSGALFTYLITSLIKVKYKWQDLIFVLLLILNCFISSFFFSFFTGAWFTATIISTCIAFILLFIIFSLIKQYLTSKHVQKIIANLKNTPTSDLVNQLIEDYNMHQWYVLYLPSENTIEIGINIYNIAPVIGKKFYIKTLTNRYFFFIPLFLFETLSLKSNFICALHDFYYYNDQTKALIEDYIFRIKTDAEKPWIINH